MQEDRDLDRLIGTYSRLNIEVQDLRDSDGSVVIKGHADAVSLRRNFSLDDYSITEETRDGSRFTVIRYDASLAEANAAPKEHVPIFAQAEEEPQGPRNVSRIKRTNRRIQEGAVRSAARKETIRSKKTDSGVQASPIVLPAEAVRTSYAGRAAAMKMNLDQLIDAFNSGDAEAALKLARTMESGNGGRTADPGLALRLYGKAAEMGSAKGLYHLGMCYLKGVGLNREDPAYARYLLEAAAAFGDSSAKVSLRDVSAEPADAPADGVHVTDIEHTDIKFRCNLF